MITRTAWKMGEEGKEGLSCIYAWKFKGVPEGITGIEYAIPKERIEVVKHEQDFLKDC